MVLTSLEEGFQAVIERLVYRAKHLPNLPGQLGHCDPFEGP